MPEYADQTPLIIAAGKGLTRTGELLLRLKDVNPDPEWCRGREPLLLATKMGREDVVRMLWERGYFSTY